MHSAAECIRRPMPWVRARAHGPGPRGCGSRSRARPSSPPGPGPGPMGPGPGPWHGPPNAFGGRMHSAAECIQRQYAFGGSMQSSPKYPKSQKIVFDLNRVATAATDIWAHGLRPQSRHESNAPYQIAYIFFFEICLLSVLCDVLWDQ